MLSEKTQPLPFPVQEGEPEGPPRKGPPLANVLFVLFWMLAGLALVAALSVFWFREIDRRQDAEKKIASARSEVAAANVRADELEEEIALVEETLAAAQKELKPWRLRSQRRGDALRSTRGVMAMVGPVRESYDDLGEALTTIDGDADALAAAASALERQVAALSDYVRRTPEAQLSKAELRELVTTLRARKAALASAHASLAEGQSGYGDAAEQVAARFDQLTRAITALRKEIEKALRR